MSARQRGRRPASAKATAARRRFSDGGSGAGRRGPASDGDGGSGPPSRGYGEVSPERSARRRTGRSPGLNGGAMNKGSLPRRRFLKAVPAAVAGGLAMPAFAQQAQEQQNQRI